MKLFIVCLYIIYLKNIVNNISIRNLDYLFCNKKIFQKSEFDY